MLPTVTPRAAAISTARRCRSGATPRTAQGPRPPAMVASVDAVVMPFPGQPEPAPDRSTGRAIRKAARGPPARAGCGLRRRNEEKISPPLNRVLEPLAGFQGHAVDARRPEVG